MNCQDSTNLFPQLCSGVCKDRKRSSHSQKPMYSFNILTFMSRYTISTFGPTHSCQPQFFRKQWVYITDLNFRRKHIKALPEKAILTTWSFKKSWTLAENFYSYNINYMFPHVYFSVKQNNYHGIRNSTPIIFHIKLTKIYVSMNSCVVVVSVYN